MRVAPTQQSTVNVTPTLQAGGSGMGGLAAKIDELLRNQREAKKKTKAQKSFTAAKKQYSAYRKKAMANIKEQNKQIKARENAKIEKLPTKDRPAARKRLRGALKKRLDRVKQDLPGRVSTPAQLTQLMKGFRTLKV